MGSFVGQADMGANCSPNTHELSSNDDQREGIIAKRSPMDCAVEGSFKETGKA